MLVLCSATALAQAAGQDQPPPARRYVDACGTCHANGGFGVRVLADRLGPEMALIHEGTRMPSEAIRIVVRQGLGHMPAMSKVEVSEEELDAIIAYLTRPAAEGGE